MLYCQEEGLLSVKVFPPSMKEYKKEGIVGYFLETVGPLELKEYKEYDSWKGELLFESPIN
jgi:hypothetical protein